MASFFFLLLMLALRSFIPGFLYYPLVYFFDVMMRLYSNAHLHGCIHHRQLSPLLKRFVVYFNFAIVCLNFGQLVLTTHVNCRYHMLLSSTHHFYMQFVRIMRKHFTLSSDQDQQIDLLCDLFTEMDVDEDEKVDWDDLITYFMEVGMQFRDLTDGDGVKRGWVKTHSTDESQHHAHIEKLYYFPGLRVIFSLEKNNTIKLYDPEELTLMHTIVGPHENVPFICADYVADHGLLAAASTNNIITFWEIGSFVPKRRIRTTYAQTSLCWDGKQRLLFSGSVRGSIHGWGIDTLQDKLMMTGHKDAVTEIVAPQQLGLLMTASLDSTVKVWDPASKAVKTNLVGHSKAVTSLAFAPTHSLLLTAGFEQDVFVWNPFIDKYVAKMKGHQSSLVSVRCSANSPQVVTADREGFVKVWDIRNFGCIETFTVSGVKEITSLCVPSVSHIVCSGTSKIGIYEYKEKLDGIVEGASQISLILFNPSAGTFITTCGPDIKVWDSRTGKLLRSHRNVSHHEITSICLDPRERRFFIGDIKGHIKSYNYHSAQFLRELSKHDEEVQVLLYAAEMKCLVSVSTEKPSVIKIHTDVDETRNLTVRTLFGQEGQVCAVSYSGSYCLLASASTDRKIFIWDLQKGISEGVLHTDSDIVTIEYLKSSPMLICADSLGNISFYTTYPASMKNTPVLRIQNNATNPCPVLKLRYNENMHQLYAVDEQGFFRAWTLPWMDHCKSPPSRGSTNMSPGHHSPDPTSHTARKWQDLFQRIQTIGPESLSRQIILSSEWPITTDPIITMVAIDDPPAFAFLSFDGIVRIFNHSGGELGIFPPHNSEDKPWLLDCGSTRLLESQCKASKYAQIVREDMESSPCRFDEFFSFQGSPRTASRFTHRTSFLNFSTDFPLSPQQGPATTKRRTSAASTLHRRGSVGFASVDELDCLSELEEVDD
eukprot:TRINITY_DN8362_c0_g1_i11.p1 TRINITY_DN8362_c0_g1~~TRINITY_DN8362_c0_g1_i11.p1  ORF type:complete len:936 (-),score=118.62 TRINITY_DN8362_c0_g1_i11:247-3054(-)